MRSFLFRFLKFKIAKLRRALVFVLQKNVKPPSDMREAWCALAEKEENLLRQMADGIKVPDTEIDAFEHEILSFLESYPLGIEKFNLSDTHDRTEVTDFINMISRIRRQAQLGVSIVSEIKHSPSPAKIRNLLLTWNMREALM